MIASRTHELKSLRQLCLLLPGWATVFNQSAGHASAASPNDPNRSLQPRANCPVDRPIPASFLDARPSTLPHACRPAHVIGFLVGQLPLNRAWFRFSRASDSGNRWIDAKCKCFALSFKAVGGGAALRPNGDVGQRYDGTFLGSISLIPSNVPSCVPDANDSNPRHSSVILRSAERAGDASPQMLQPVCWCFHRARPIGTTGGVWDSVNLGKLARIVSAT
jgi:hypothetical protein